MSLIYYCSNQQCSFYIILPHHPKQLQQLSITCCIFWLWWRGGEEARSYWAERRLHNYIQSGKCHSGNYFQGNCPRSLIFKDEQKNRGKSIQNKFLQENSTGENEFSQISTYNLLKLKLEHPVYNRTFHKSKKCGACQPNTFEKGHIEVN